MYGGKDLWNMYIKPSVMDCEKALYVAGTHIFAGLHELQRQKSWTYSSGTIILPFACLLIHSSRKAS